MCKGDCGTVGEVAGAGAVCAIAPGRKWPVKMRKWYQRPQFRKPFET